MSEISVSADGFVVDAGFLGSVFGVAPDTIRAEMRDGTITSRCETGVDEDAGTSRLTFYRAGRALRLVVDDKGSILKRSSFPVSARPRHQAGRP
ncbi:DUF6522 family protein [Microbulbifer sp. S227A]|uniref:DUF6522 family protein n=1 Tax=Microbulbifer sp. S227A TaxID=3415131 RepID=UPI003C7DEFCD